MSEERRRYDDKNWERVFQYIEDSKQYRGSLDEKVVGIKEDIVELKEKVKIQNGRVNALELKNANLNGKIASVGAVGTFIGWVITNFFKS